MTTMEHARAALEFARTLQKTEEGRKDLSDSQALLEDPEQKEFVDAVGQPYDGWTVGQIASLGRIHALYSADLVGVLRIHVGAAPNPSGEVNQGNLDDKLPDCFSAGVAADIGVLSWKPHVREGLPGGWTNGALLMVGYADASKTLEQLAERGVVARWPHHSDDIWLFGFARFTDWLNWGGKAEG